MIRIYQLAGPNEINKTFQPIIEFFRLGQSINPTIDLPKKN
jgi:hypothetical protein